MAVGALSFSAAVVPRKESAANSDDDFDFGSRSLWNNVISNVGWAVDSTSSNAQTVGKWMSDGTSANVKYLKDGTSLAPVCVNNPDDAVPDTYMPLAACSAEVCAMECASHCGVYEPSNCNCAFCPTPPECPQTHVPPTSATHMAISGGGWRAMSSGMGASRALHEMGHLSNIDTFSTNSGGSWHISQLAMSQRYADAVTKGDFEANLKEYYSIFKSIVPDGYTPDSETYDSCYYTLGTDSHYCKLVGMSAYFDFSWTKFIAAMLKAYSPLDEKSHQTGLLKDATLVINTAVPSSAFLEDQTAGPYSLLKADSKTKMSGDRLLTASYVIPAKGDNFWKLSGNDAGKIEYELKQNGYRGFFLPRDEPVHSVVAASSAAAGILAAPKMLGQLIYLSEKTAKLYPEAAVRMGGIQFIDGGYVDNTGVAAGIAQIQKRGTTKTTKEAPLRFVILDNSLPPSNPDACAASLGFLFLDTPSTTAGKLKTFSAKTFKQDWSEIQPQLQDASFDGSRGDDPAPKWARIAVETTDNLHFGVEGGWAVELFIILQNSKAATVLGYDQDPQPYIDTALNMHLAVKSLQTELDSFFKV